jgi:ketosteroid isomerase-like protein
MSANLDLVRSIYAEWERGDFSSADWADPEIEYVTIGGVFGDGTSTGVAGMAERWRDSLSHFADLRTGADEYRELDEERLLVLIRGSGGRGKASGIDIADIRTEGAHLFHVCSGKVTRLVVYLDRERALADLGLKE